MRLPSSSPPSDKIQALEAGSVISGDQVAQPVARNLTVVFTGRAFTIGLQFAAFAVAAAYLEPALLGVYTFSVAVARNLPLLPSF